MSTNESEVTYDELAERAELVAVIDDEAGSYDPITTGCGYHESLKLADGSDMAERIADKVIYAGLSPVLPSSTVDEDALAEVIGRDENYTRDIGFGGWTLSPRLAARAVAEWLESRAAEIREGK